MLICAATGCGLMRWLEGISFLATILGIPGAIWTLSSEYRWRRRQFAADMIREWSDHTSEHRAAIEREIPRIFDKDPGNGFDRKRAERIYNQVDRTREASELKRHLVELLNYCEFVSVTFQMNVADKPVVRKSFQSAICMLHRALHAYIDVMTERRDGNPWQPFCDLCEEWQPGVHQELARKRPGAG